METNALKYRLAQERVRLGLWRVDPTNGVILGSAGRPIGRRTPPGYVMVAFRHGARSAGKNLHAFAHRVIWEATVGPIAPGLVINHRNGVKHDNRLTNLEVVTDGANLAHAFQTGLIRPRTGSRCNMARLDESDVAEIKAALAGGALQVDLAARYGVHKTQISRIALGKAWVHVAA